VGVTSSRAWLPGLLLLLAASGARAETDTSLVVATGQLGMRKEIRHALGIDVQVRSPWRWELLRPIGGVLTSSNGGAYLYSGIVADVPLPGTFRLSPGFAPGVVLAKGGCDLGSPIEFRSSVELSVNPVDFLRFGVAFSHISNGRLGERNPGVELLMFSIAIPARR